MHWLIGTGLIVFAVMIAADSTIERTNGNRIEIENRAARVPVGSLDFPCRSPQLA